ncbi:hypothetical protein FJY93_02295 [Candidatus Kaiserbacteria bacterium]|nr:hypothetical protein [Candidatus Kaiserbacteria bacterium]
MLAWLNTISWVSGLIAAILALVLVHEEIRQRAIVWREWRKLTFYDICETLKFILVRIWIGGIFWIAIFISLILFLWVWLGFQTFIHS